MTSWYWQNQQLVYLDRWEREGLIEAHLTDYLMRKSDCAIIEGSEKKKDIERIWSFTYQSGRWIVSDIDEGSNSLAYLEMMKSVPAIEDVFQPHNANQTMPKL
ncbi:MAG: hypothetical protein ACJAQT_000416 [Akkermansiaceae bacterium]|jgi:hypothetical protein